MWNKIKCFFDFHEMKEIGNYEGEILDFDNSPIQVLIGRCKWCNDEFATGSKGEIFLIKGMAKND